MFDSDQAVEGLMARHVLRGEFPVFLWGQHYKGVPEVYLAGGVFALAGSNVVALKAVTLACFVAFVCLQFRLVEELMSRPIAWLAVVFTVASPPSLVFWSLSANAEIVMTLLAGAVMGLALERWRRSRSMVACGVASLAAGFGLWVHQYIVYYLASFAVAAALGWSNRAERLRQFAAAREFPAWLRAIFYVVLAVAFVYAVLGLIAFVTGGFDIRVFSVIIGLRSPQKLWRVAGALAALCLGTRVVARLSVPEGRAMRSLALCSAAGFAIGYAPALVAAARFSGSAPIGRMDVYELAAAAGPIGRQVVPIVLGFRSPTTEWLGVSGWGAAAIVITVVASVIAIRSRQMTPFFHLFAILTPALFLASGAYVDPQSYRYLMPLYAALPVLYALGVDEISRWNRAAGVAVAVLLLGVFAVQQVAWYGRLVPDGESPAIIRCLDEHGARAAFADYWRSYKVTFLTNERLIVAPYNGVDRYPPYSSFARSQGVSVEAQPCHSILVQ